MKKNQKMYQKFTTSKQEEKTKHDKYHGKKSMKTRFELNEIKKKTENVQGVHNNKTRRKNKTQ